MEKEISFWCHHLLYHNTPQHTQTDVWSTFNAIKHDFWVKPLSTFPQGSKVRCIFTIREINGSIISEHLTSWSSIATDSLLFPRSWGLWLNSTLCPKGIQPATKELVEDYIFSLDVGVTIWCSSGKCPLEVSFLAKILYSLTFCLVMSACVCRSLWGEVKHDASSFFDTRCQLKAFWFVVNISLKEGRKKK